MQILKSILQHPRTKGHNLDDPETTNLRRDIILAKPFLQRIYQEWYGQLTARLGESSSKVLEIGAGAGLSNLPKNQVIRSDIMVTKWIDIACDCQNMPFLDAQFGAILMIDVLHHLPDPQRFFREACRCLMAGGVIRMIEPWNTKWSSWVYRNLHHEPFDPTRLEWGLTKGGPLSQANGALPWIIFKRDLPLFTQRFPQLSIEEIKPIMPLVYLLSGGLAYRNFMPGFTYNFWRKFEANFEPRSGMFVHIELRKS
jgi:SAM-dependent methyltransferase